MYKKPHLTWDKQLQKLKNKNLIIKDDKKALKELKNLNYYRLSAYFIPFYDNNKNFINGTTFDDIIDLYNFDKKLRIITLEALQTIELYFKTQIAYHHSEKYGAVGYLKSKNFINKQKAKIFIDNMKEKIIASKELSIQHHATKYGKYVIPLWVGIEIMSFGELSHFYNILYDADKNNVVKAIGIHNNLIKNWLHCLSSLRNICAHHARLWNKTLTLGILIPNKKPKMQVLMPNNKTVFTYFTIILFILEKIKPNDQNFKKAIKDLFKKYPKVNKSSMGFCHNWEQISYWK